MEIQKILVVGGYYAPSEKPQIHYSGTKDINLAIGFKHHCSSVFMVSKNRSDSEHGINFIPLANISLEFLDSFDLIIFTREQFMESILQRNQEFENYIFDYPDRRAILISRMGSSAWMSKTRWGRNKLYNAFDFHFPQTAEFVKAMKAKCGNDPDNKIYPSAMAVPMTLPPKEKCPFIKHNHNLIYMGRMRHNPSRMPTMIQMMRRLGKQYHLNILPGTFSKPDMKEGRNKFGPENRDNFKWLTKYFSVSSNITIHKPLEWGQHWNYLYHSDIAVDFSPNSKCRKHAAGNAKLLEYMAAGLPVVVEVGPGNLNLVHDCRGGIVLNQGADAKQYAVGIQKAIKATFDRKHIAKITMKNQNWKVRAGEILSIIKGKK